jgi:DNA-binding NtrC family response regulator
MPRAEPRAECRVLVVEDEWFLADDLQTALGSFGADVIALVGDLHDARDLLARGGFDVGIIDINLRGHDAFCLADDLQRKGIPFVFATGYSAETIPMRFANIARWEKPFDPYRLARSVMELCHGPSEPKPKRRSLWRTISAYHAHRRPTTETAQNR